MGRRRKNRHGQKGKTGTFAQSRGNSDFAKEEQGRGLSNEDRELWARVRQSLVPLNKKADRLHFGPLRDEKPMVPGRSSAGAVNPKRERKGNPPASSPVQRQVKQASSASPPPQLQAISRRDMRKVNAGHQPIEATLDLHGLHQDAAHLALRQFLARCHRQDLRHVLVITGKGRPSLFGSSDEALFGQQEPGVLRRIVPLWLAEAEFRFYISGFSTAPRRLGGEGALYLRLRRGQT